MDNFLCSGHSSTLGSCATPSGYYRLRGGEWKRKENWNQRRLLYTKIVKFKRGGGLPTYFVLLVHGSLSTSIAHSKTILSLFMLFPIFDQNSPLSFKIHSNTSFNTQFQALIPVTWH